MTKKERFRRAINGDEVDRLPVSVWLHFASEHWPGEEVARLHLAYQAEYDWDYVKVMNDYRYPLPGIDQVESGADLLRFEPLSMEEPAFAEQLRCLRRLRAELPDVPLVETVFNPLQTIVRGAGRAVLDVMKAHPREARHALEACTETLIRYVQVCREAGVDALFFSVNGASRAGSPGGMSDEEYAEYVAPYDRRVLEAAEGMIRIAHVHGFELEFDRVLSYPVEAYNWSHHHTAPSLADARRLTGAALIGGVNELAVASQTPHEVAADIRAAVEEAGSRRFLVGSGCTVPPDTPRRILHAARRAVEGLALTG